MLTIEEMVAKAKEDGASDIHLICGIRPKYRLSGNLEDMTDEVLTADDCVSAARLLCGNRYDEFLEVGDLDAAETFADIRQNTLRPLRGKDASGFHCFCCRKSILMHLQPIRVRSAASNPDTEA